MGKDRYEGRYQTKHMVRHVETGLGDRTSASQVERTSSFQADRQNSRPVGLTPGRQTHQRLERLAIRPIERLITRHRNERVMEKRRAALGMPGSSTLERVAHIKQEKEDKAVLAVRKLFEIPMDTSNRIAQEQQRLRQQQQQEIHRQVILHQQTSLVQHQTKANMNSHLGKLAATEGRRSISTVRSPAKRKAPLPLELRTQQKVLFMKRPAGACQTVVLRKLTRRH